MDRKEQMRFGETTVTAREMTVQEVYDFLEGRMSVAVDPDIDVLVEHKIGSQLMLVCTDADGETLRRMTPTQLQTLADKIAELNPFFMRLLGTLEGLAEPTPKDSAAE
jgi:hypothetical protein